MNHLLAIPKYKNSRKNYKLKIAESGFKLITL